MTDREDGTMLKLRPWYVWRPAQVARRVALRARPPSPGYRPIPVAWGGSVVADPTRRPLGTALVANAVYDLAVSEALARLIRPGAAALDAGANVGYMAALMARLVGPGGVVVAFEPHPGLFEVLARNVGPARPGRVLRNEALGSEPGTADLIVPESANDGVAYLAGVGTPFVSPSGRSDTVSVPVTTVDAAIGSGRVAVMKVDVEGSELAVLRGACAALAERRITHVVFEDHEGPGSPSCELLAGHGYTLFALGYSLMGPVVAPIDAGRLASDHEAPSYLATVDPDGATRACRPRGWRVLRRLPG